ncbi:MAG: ubiquinol-cytochrome c reductase iron-sulfur subunit [Deltaproteobacteria bacterium]|nr:ubiquinol-cytochrome c reductase iron-sulfur subunit [Deltaproteobacteria bacterium]
MPSCLPLPDAGRPSDRGCEDGGFLALSRKCTHLGCAVAWDEQRQLFACPCHASTFDRSGDVRRSPAPRPLDLHPLTIENGKIMVELGVRRRRQSCQPQQLTYPAGRQ